MSAAQAREELEAAIWQRVHDSAARPTGLTRQGMDAILTAADKYATSLAAEVLDGTARERRQDDRQQRLAEAAAEYWGASR